MHILGGRKYVEIPGDKRHELPPLLIQNKTVKDVGTVMEQANEIVDSEELIPPSTIEESATGLEAFERRRMELAINLVDQYFAFLNEWHWGDGILDWIRQCETTFDINVTLRNLLKPDVWPHAGRVSFVTLLRDKGIKPKHVDLEKAVGMRLTFREPPPISCFSNQFLLLLNQPVANTAYEAWVHMMPDPVSSLPPERFTFQVYTL